MMEKLENYLSKNSNTGVLFAVVLSGTKESKEMFST